MKATIITLATTILMANFVATNHATAKPIFPRCEFSNTEVIQWGINYEFVKDPGGRLAFSIYNVDATFFGNSRNKHDIRMYYINQYGDIVELYYSGDSIKGGELHRANIHQTIIDSVANRFYLQGWYDIPGLDHYCEIEIKP